MSDKEIKEPAMGLNKEEETEKTFRCGSYGMNVTFEDTPENRRKASSMGLEPKVSSA